MALEITEVEVRLRCGRLLGEKIYAPTNGEHPLYAAMDAVIRVIGKNLDRFPYEGVLAAVRRDHATLKQEEQGILWATAHIENHPYSYDIFELIPGDDALKRRILRAKTYRFNPIAPEEDMADKKACPRCNGTGVIDEDVVSDEDECWEICPACGGSGFLDEEKKEED